MKVGTTDGFSATVTHRISRMGGVLDPEFSLETGATYIVPGTAEQRTLRATRWTDTSVMVPKYKAP